MISPKIPKQFPVDPGELSLPSPTEIQENKKNGFGYWMHLPTPAAPLDETLPELREYGDYTEMPGIVDAVSRDGAVLIIGEPGSGKSHIIRDLQTACVANNVPAFCLTMHINSGSKQGPENVQPYLDEFRDKVKETGGGLVILDNVDILGYRGRTKRRSLTTAYAQAMEPVIQELIDDPNLAVVATAHDDAWREGRWTWEDPAIDEPAQKVLEAFPSRFVFEGKMALVGLAHILQARHLARKEGEPPIPLGKAAQVIRLLHASGRANFFHSNHLDVDLFLEDPQAAIDKIEKGRTERRSGRG